MFSNGIVHPSYNNQTHDNDIYLLQLASPVTFTNYIQPICLATSGSTFYNGTDSWVTGWGTTSTSTISTDLREVSVPIVGNRQCNCDYGVGRITDNMICAGLSAGGKDSCQGDSGGPMVSKQSTRCIQCGIASFGEGCALPNFPGVYTRVSQYQSWINSTITSNQPGFITFTSTGTDSDLSVSCEGLPPPPTTTTTTTITTTTTPKPVVCGQAPMNSRILGGSPTAGMWPWMVSLQRNGSHVCGGTLVAVDYVLSDANCFSSSSRPSDWTAVLGQLKQNGSNPFEVTLNVTNITLSNLTGSNVALLHLGSQPTLSNYIQPICLDNGQTFTVGSTCWAAGWSSGRGGGETGLLQIHKEVFICFSVQGDSGGPLMCKLGSSWYQAAVLTLSTNNATNQTRATSNNVFTKLSTFDNFLLKILGNFLSPGSSSNTTTTATGGGTAHSFFALLFILIMSLHLFL
uniref:Peptidase S1 domain-containing protein n=1 Tax=Anabas testudineus TaxID=64144 RepID=A0A3Q1IWK7_ANATE